MKIQLNRNTAIAADNFRQNITEKGKYLGQFTQANYVESKLGSKGIELAFKSDTGATADYLQLWLYNGQGKELHGLKVLNAIMACLRIKEIDSQNGMITKWENGQKVQVAGVIYPQLVGKPIGLLLQMEEYEKRDGGGTGWKPSIFSAFDINEFTASEIMTGATKPEKLGGMVAALKDRPLKNKPAQQQDNGFGSQMADTFGATPADDDIPW